MPDPVTEEHIEQWIRNLLIKKYTGLRELGSDPRIFHDLKLRGEDAGDFLEDVSSQFDVDLSGMRFPRYFPAEYYSPRDFVVDLFRIADTRWQEPRLKHLVKVCKEKKWFEPR
jgi:hypothetical protein